MKTVSARAVTREFTVGNLTLKWKSSVIYLGSKISEDGKTIETVKHRVACVSSVVDRLNNRVFKRRSVSDKMKGHFINFAVFSSILYGLEHCAIGARDRRRLDGYFLQLAKRVMQLRFDYHLSYAEAEKRLGVDRPSVQLARNRLRWTGHALRSNDTVFLLSNRMKELVKEADQDFASMTPHHQE